MRIRLATIEYDFDHLKCIWRDAAWDTEIVDYEAELRHHLPDARCLVADAEGELGAVAVAMAGEFRFLSSALPLSAITAVLTAAPARRQGYAGRLLAELLAQEQARGAVVAALGAFDQGYYEKVGFGTAGCDPCLVINPAALCLPERARQALTDPQLSIRRIRAADSPALFAAQLRRHQAHGACTLTKPGFVAGAIHGAAQSGFGLAIVVAGTIVAHFFGRRLSEERLDIYWLCADTPDRYLQLLEVIHRLSDQLEQVKIIVPPEIIVSDFLARPLRDGLVVRDHPFDDMLLWQLRILDLVQAIEAVALPIATPIRFDLELTDPIADYATSWQGTAGRYQVSLGARSRCTPTRERHAGAHSAGRCGTSVPHTGVPRLSASINAFSRFWVGAASAAALAHSDHFAAPAPLIARLTQEYRLPLPLRDCDF